MSSTFNTAGWSLLTSKTISILILLVIILYDVESKPLRTTDPVTYSVHYRGPKWFSWKFCGKLGDVCKVNSRKHCCSVGFTCVLPLKQLYKKIRNRHRFGRCQPVPTIPIKHREISAVIDPTRKQS